MKDQHPVALGPGLVLKPAGAAAVPCAVGTIFGIYKAKNPGSGKYSLEDVLRVGGGRASRAAPSCLAGPRRCRALRPGWGLQCRPLAVVVWQVSVLPMAVPTDNFG